MVDITGTNLFNTQNKLQNIALIVDDELSNRVILRSLLKRFGYQVFEAVNGQTGVEMFKTHTPDVVFMDILMPEMDGYEATTKIKMLAHGSFVPIIFLTALTDEQALARCIEAGGDDFLTKPFSHTILKSKLRALERIRTLHWEVDRLYQRMRLEEEMAQKVFSTAVLGNNVAMDLIPHRLQSAAIFSGDLLLTAWSPSGDLHLLLGDFTGHGLSAALGALPTAAVFRTMTAKGFPPDRILAVMNEELHDLLPSGMFLAAIFVRVLRSLEYIQVFNSGLPDGLILDQMGIIRQRLSSQLLPLGIIPWQNMAAARQQIEIESGWRILLVSDGVTEARSHNGTIFGQDGLESAIKLGANNSSVLAAINQALDNFCDNTPQIDDISVVEIPCISTLFAPKSCQNPVSLPLIPKESSIAIRWQVNLSLQGAVRLINIDPVPILITQIQELEETTLDNHAIFNLLTSLYNAVIERSLSDAYPHLNHVDIIHNRIQLLAALSDTVEVHIHLICEQVGELRRLRVYTKTGQSNPIEGITWL